MSIYKDNVTGKWRVVYRYTDWTGETHQSSKRGFPTKREALMWERELLLKKEAKLDIIEEIVGEIHDEYDDEERTYVVLNDHTWIFEAKTQLTDFYKIAKVDEDEFEKVVGDADTLAGMLLEIKGEFPALHEKVTYHNYEFEVLEMDSRRILKVKFTILPKEMEDGVVSAV